jgi:predicted dehydrogenase
MTKKLVVIGSGRIAESHIEAARANGFKLYGICSSDNSKTALSLAKKHSFSHYFPTIEKLLEVNFDAAAIICNTTNIPRVYEKLSQKNVAILAEKPFSINCGDFNENMLKNDKLLIGYNRRFYSSINALKTKLISDSYYSAIMEISEFSWDSNSSQIERERAVLDNSVHMLDLIYYLFGDFESIEINRSFINHNLSAINAKLHYVNGIAVEVRITFGIPVNNSISVRFKDSVANCKPIEMYVLHDQMKMIAPDSLVKFKRYQPISSKDWALSKFDNDFKPGFYLQYKELSDLVDGNPIRIGATPAQAYKVFKLSKILIGATDER